MPSDPFEWWEYQHWGSTGLDGTVTKEGHKEYNKDCPFCNPKVHEMMIEEL